MFKVVFCILLLKATTIEYEAFFGGIVVLNFAVAGVHISEMFEDSS